MNDVEVLKSVFYGNVKRIIESKANDKTWAGLREASKQTIKRELETNANLTFNTMIKVANYVNRPLPSLLM